MRFTQPHQPKSTCLSELLPYEAYDEKTQTYTNHHSVGFVLETSLLVGANQETIEILHSLLTDVLPLKADIQWIIQADPNIDGVLAHYRHVRTHLTPMLSALVNQRVAYYQQLASAQCQRSRTLLMRQFKSYLSVSLAKNQVGVHATLNTLMQSVITTLKSVNIWASPLAPDKFIALIRQRVYGDLAQDTVSGYHPLQYLSEQVLDLDVHLTHHLTHIQLYKGEQEKQAHYYTVSELPKQGALWQMHDILGQLFNDTLQIPCSFSICLNLRGIDTNKSQALAQMRYLNKSRAAQSQLARFYPGFKEEQQDWDLVRNRLQNGEQLYQAHYQVAIQCRQEDFAKCDRRLRDLFKANGWGIHKPHYLQLSLFLSSLPMMMSEGLFDDIKVFKRFKTLTSRNVVNLLPVLGEWFGNGMPKLLLPGRRGQIACWDPFVNPEGNYNMSIVASSGRGKSTFTQEYMVSQLATGGQVWVIDVGRSYEKTAKLLGGVFLEFSDEQPMSLNPFSNIENFSNDLELLILLFSTMTRPHSEASDEELAHLEKALKTVWQTHHQSSTVTHVARVLQQSPHPVANNMALLLYPYTQAGRYGQYFEGPSTFNFDARLIVLELEELKSKKDLQKIVLLLLMYRITQAMFLGDRTIEKTCIIDEAWDLLGNSNSSTARFIETGYRRARRYNANFVTITQSINDYYKNPAALAAYENADWSIVLGQKNEAIVKAKEQKQFYMDAYTERLMKSLRKTEDYSECMIKGPAGASVHRIIFEPFSRILYSSKASEYARVQALEAQGLTLHAAIAQVAQEVFG